MLICDFATSSVFACANAASAARMPVCNSAPCKFRPPSKSIFRQSGLTSVNEHADVIASETSNPAAKKLLDEVYTITDMKWRGIGNIPDSGFRLAEKYTDFDAELKFDVGDYIKQESPLCIAGEVLQGLKKPGDCPAFGRECKPENPLGAPMVSSEGACSAYYRYRKSETGQKL